MADQFTPTPVKGKRTNNNAAPTDDNIPVIPSVANASDPSLTEGNQTALSTDLSGNLRTKINAALPAGTNTIGSIKITDGTNTASVRDTGSNDSLNVAIVDGSGNQITSFGGGTEYTEDAAAAADPVGKAIILVRSDTPATVTNTDGDNVAQRGTNYGAAYVQVVNSSGSFVDSFGGGTQYTEDAAAASDPVGTQLISRRRDSLSSEVTTDGDVIAVNSTGKGELYVKHVDAIPVTDNAGSLTVDNGGTFVVQENGSALTSLQLIDDIVYTDDTSTHATGTSKGALLMAAATPTDGSVDANDIGAVAMTTDRKLHVSVRDALPAGTNAIGKLSSNDGVDIGDVTINNASGGSAVNIQDGGNSITVDSGAASLAISVNTSANAVNNPIFTKLTDGTNALGTSSNPLVVSNEGAGAGTLVDSGLLTSSALAAGGSATLSSADITNSTTGKLIECTASSSVRLKVTVEVFDGATPTSKRVFFVEANQNFVYQPADRDEITQAGGAGKKIRLTIKNMDNVSAADCYASITHVEV